MRDRDRLVLRLLAILWASPYTVMAVALGLLNLPFGGQVRCRAPVIQCFDGPISWLLARGPLPGGIAAITFGHVVFGRSAADLDRSHSHELIHVRQYERWGPLFGPAYLIASAAAWFSGNNPYRDNPFEVQAFLEAREQP